LADSDRKKGARSGDDRRRADKDRRSGTDRRSGHERRRGVPGRPSTGSGRPERVEGRVESDRRSGLDRRRQQRRSGRDRRGREPVGLDAPGGEPALEAVLVAAALAARERAHAPFSQFKVGAALETADGDIVTGCNVENATYGLTMCAERVAIFKAISDGHRRFARVAVVADTAAPTPPCGACRQLLWEFCGDVEVVLANLGGVTGRWRLSALLPLPFDARLLR
jgi:cytidine deaminase